MSKGKEATRPPTLGRQSRPQERDKYAEKVIASMTRTSKMPNVVPRDGIKIFVRRRGGLNIAKLQVTVATAIRQAAGVSREDGKTDKFCPMVYLNVVVVSTLDERRARACARLQFIRVGDQVHEVGAYQTTPDGMVKGIIRGVPVEDTPVEIHQNIVQLRNLLAREAQRIGNTTTVIVAFEGRKAPNHVCYETVLLWCSLYRKLADACTQCARVGHRKDVCPNSSVKVCIDFGANNRAVNRAVQQPASGLVSREGSMLSNPLCLAIQVLALLGECPTVCTVFPGLARDVDVTSSGWPNEGWFSSPVDDRCWIEETTPPFIIASTWNHCRVRSVSVTTSEPLNLRAGSFHGSGLAGSKEGSMLSNPLCLAMQTQRLAKERQCEQRQQQPPHQQVERAQTSFPTTIVLTLADRGCTTVSSDSKTAVRNYARSRECVAAARVLRARNLAERTVTIRWLPAHNGKEVSPRGCTNYNQTANEAARGFTYGATQPADSI
ncbi:hypothetical protein HPB51_003788 [Rhipicephalus microplus]|uniref:Tick transposon n=1 Tax=Rhipicephalus microplus TaxID=6941 RepID=A0A9J6EXB7_RHIMP|nr:hypothetical protein HPB51_003788 [Rhipicephalus microplus]